MLIITQDWHYTEDLHNSAPFDVSIKTMTFFVK